MISGERPYKCHLQECGRAFIQLSNLQQHLRNHDAQLERSKNRPFHCNICGKGFATESSLRTHTSKVCKDVSFYSIFTWVSFAFARFWMNSSIQKWLPDLNASLVFGFAKCISLFHIIFRFSPNVLCLCVYITHTCGVQSNSYMEYAFCYCQLTMKWMSSAGQTFT